MRGRAGGSGAGGGWLDGRAGTASQPREEEDGQQKKEEGAQDQLEIGTGLHALIGIRSGVVDGVARINSHTTRMVGGVFRFCEQRLDVR